MENKIAGFFILVVGLLWNPLTIYWLYNGSPMVHSKIFLGLGCAVPLVAFWLSRTIKKRALPLPKGPLNFTLLFSFSVVVFFFLLLGNRALRPSMASAKTQHEGLIFEPNSVAQYNTSEFSCKANINSIGLRNGEVQIQKQPDTKRILCFGDSWTFGWGVEEQWSWPHQLHDRLNANNALPKFEVINAGQGGQYTEGYKKYISRAVPLLHPDIVLVGVLQGDDLAQIHEAKCKSKSDNAESAQTGDSKWNSIKGWFNNWLDASIGNYKAKWAQAQAQEVDVKSNWRLSVQKAMSDFDEFQQLRFQLFPEQVQGMFVSGDLNPGLLNQYVAFPDRFHVFNNPNLNCTKEALTIMKNDVLEMKKVCDQNGAVLVFVNMPTNYFTGHRVVRTPMDHLNAVLENQNHIDSMYADVAATAKVPYIELTQAFRALEPKDKYFFTFDGHPNQLGYAEIAKLIEAQLLTQGLLR